MNIFSLPLNTHRVFVSLILAYRQADRADIVLDLLPPLFCVYKVSRPPPPPRRPLFLPLVPQVKNRTESRTD